MDVEQAWRDIPSPHGESEKLTGKGAEDVLISGFFREQETAIEIKRCDSTGAFEGERAEEVSRLLEGFYAWAGGDFELDFSIREGAESEAAPVFDGEGFGGGGDSDSEQDAGIVENGDNVRRLFDTAAAADVSYVLGGGGWAQQEQD